MLEKVQKGPSEDVAKSWIFQFMCFIAENSDKDLHQLTRQNVLQCAGNPRTRLKRNLDSLSILDNMCIVIVC